MILYAGVRLTNTDTNIDTGDAVLASLFYGLYAGFLLGVAGTVFSLVVYGIAFLLRKQRSSTQS